MNEENTTPEGAPERFSSKYLDIADKYNMNDAELSEYLQYQDIKDDEFNSILNERSRRNQEKAALDQQMLQTKIGQINTEIEQLERQPEEETEKLRVGALREFGASTLETFGKLDYLFSTLTGGYGSGMIGPLASLPPDVRLQMVKDEAEDVREGMREIEGGFMENITPFDGEGNFLDGLNYAFTSIAGSIPSMALIGGTGGAGVYLFGAAEGLSAYHDVKYRKDMSNAEKFGYSLFSGTIEAASEKVSAGIIGKSFKGAKNSIKDNLLSRQFSRGMLKTMGLGGAEEFGAEFSAGVLQSLNQQAFLSDRDIDYKAAFKAGIEGGIIGALGGGAFGGLGYTAGALSVDAAQKTAMEIDSQLAEAESKRKELLRELDNASTEAEKRTIGSLIVDFDRKRAEAFDKKSSRYRVMRRRNPEALQELNSKAVMIQAAKMRYESATTDAARQVIKSNLEGLINDFNAIDAAALDPDAQLTITEKYQDAMDDINMAIRESEADLEAVADMEPQNDGDLIAVQGVMDRISSLKNLKKNLMRASGEVDAAMRSGKNLEIAKAEAKLDDLLSESLPSDANDLVNKKQVEDDLGQDSSVDTVVEDVETEIPELDVITANSSSLLGDDFVENTKGTEINFGIMGAVNNMLSAFKSANVGVVIHRTSDSYNTARGKSDGASVAFYDKETNNIHLSPKATPNTVKHEFIHGALRSVFDNKEARTRLFNEVRKIANSDPAARDLYNRIVTAYTEQGYTGKRLEEEVIVNFIEKLSEPSVYEQVQQKGIIQKIIDAINRILGTRFNVPDSMLITDKSELMDVVKAFRFAEDTGGRVDVQSLADEMSDGRFDSISKAYPDLIDKEVTYTVHQPSNNSLGYKASYKTVKVRDYFHWRNFWASMTGNGKKDWIVQATYKMDDGRTKLIKKPSPKRDRRTGEVLDMEPKFKSYAEYHVDRYRKQNEAYKRIQKENAQIRTAQYYLKEEGIDPEDLSPEDMLFVEDRVLVKDDHKLDSLEDVEPLMVIKGGLKFKPNARQKLIKGDLKDYKGLPSINLPYDETNPKETRGAGIAGIANPKDPSRRLISSVSDRSINVSVVQALTKALKNGFDTVVITHSSMSIDAVLSNPVVFDEFFKEFYKRLDKVVLSNTQEDSTVMNTLSTMTRITNGLVSSVDLKGDRAATLIEMMQDVPSFDMDTLTISDPKQVFKYLETLSNPDILSFDQRRIFIKKLTKKGSLYDEYLKDHGRTESDWLSFLDEIIPEKEFIDKFRDEAFKDMPPNAIVAAKVIKLKREGGVVNFKMEKVDGPFQYAVTIPKDDIELLYFENIYDFNDIYGEYEFKSGEFKGSKVKDLVGSDKGTRSIAALRRGIVITDGDSVLDSLVDTDSLTLDQFQPREQSTIDSITTRFKVKLQDRFAKVMMLQEDIEKFRGKPVSESRDFKASEELMHGQTKDSLDKLEDKVKSIAEDMKSGGFNSDDVSDYVYAKHAKERNKLIYERSEGKVEDGSGMSDQRAEEILNSYTGKQKEDMEAIAAKVKAIVEDTRKTYVEFGLESQSTIDAFEEMFKDYVPLSGIASDELDGETSYYPTGGGGLPVYGSTVKKARGRKTQAQNILAQVIAQNAQAKVRGHKNKAMNTLYNLVKDNPNEKVWRITNSVKYDSEHAVGVRVNGEQKYIVFRDSSMAKSLKNMGVEKLDFFSKLLRAPAQWLRRSFTTANPEFIISNFARDIQSSVFNALAEAEIEGGMINGKEIALKIVGGVKTTLPQLAKNAIGRPMTAEMQRYFDEFKEDGGQTGWAHIKPVSQIAAEIEAMTTEDSKAKKAKEWMAKNSIEVIENINDAFENSIRLSAYIEARKSGASRTKAAQLAKNITVNFNKHGELGPVANAWFLFFNASIQGTARLGRSLLKLKPAYVPFGGKKSGIQRLNSAQKLAGGLSLLSGMLAMINIALSDEDEDGELFYNKIPDYEKERNLIMMYDGKHYIKIPLPYGFNIFANIGTALTEVSTGNREAVDALNFIAMSTMSSFSPISFGQSKDMFNYLGKAVVPTVFKPVVEIMTNETYFGGSVYREQFPVGAKKPESELGFKSPKNVQEFFKWMNEATGGNEFESGWIDQNPDKFWHIFDYYLGGAGQFLNRSGEFLHGMGASIAEGEKLPMEANDIPFLRKLYGDPSKYYDYQLYTDRKEEIQQLYKTVRSGDYEKGDPKYKGIGSLDKQVKNVEKRLKALRAKRKQAYDLDYFERQKMLAELFEKEREIVMAFNKRYNETRGE
jgi:hypothetical protein